MRSIKTNIRKLVGLLVLAVAMTSLFGSVVLAQQPAAGAAPKKTTCDPKTEYCTPFKSSDGATAVPTGCNIGGAIDSSQPQDSCKGQRLINTYITPAVTALSALAGIAIAGSFLFGAIQYITAGGDSGKVAAAKKRILLALILLVVFIFFYSFMRFILPGSNL